MVRYPTTDSKGPTDESRRCGLEDLIAQYISVTNPTIILIGHSMDGIIVTESVLLSLSNTDPSTKCEDSATISILPFIEGVLSFDTQYVGIAPSVLAHGIDIPYQFARDIVKQRKVPIDANAGLDGPRGLAWKQWLISVLGGVFVAGSAYLARDTLMRGLKNLGSHIVFVESLARRVELESRSKNMVKVAQVHRVGFVNLFVVLGQWGGSATAEVMERVARGEMRSFCEVPQVESSMTAFLPVENGTASNEIEAHMSIFDREKNSDSDYEYLVARSANLISSWVQR